MNGPLGDVRDFISEVLQSRPARFGGQLYQHIAPGLLFNGPVPEGRIPLMFKFEPQYFMRSVPLTFTDTAMRYGNNQQYRDFIDALMLLNQSGEQV